MRHLRRFLEAGGRDEARALHGGLGDAQELRAGGGGLGLDALGRRAAQGLDLGVRLVQGLDRHDRPLGEVAVALVRDLLALGQFLVHGIELEAIHDRAGQEGRVAEALHADLPQHLRDDDLDVLIVDLHALAAVDVLDLAGQIVLHGLFARDAEDVVGHERPIDEGLAGADEGAGVDAEVLAVRDEVFALDAAFAADDDRPLAAALLAQQLHDAVDLGDDCRVLGLAGLEDLRHAGQAAGDVLGAGDFAGRLGQQRAGGDAGCLP